MIRIVNEADTFPIKSDDPFYTRVLSLFESYGAGYAFVGFWIQENDGEIVSAISRFEDKFSLYLTDGSDMEELAAFLSFQGAGSVMLDSRFDFDFDSAKEISGDVLVYRGENYISDTEICEPDFKTLYSLLKSCESDAFIVPDYMMFLSDVTHRSSLGKCSVRGVRVDGVLASSVMTVSETSDAVIIGAVATHPAYRRRGLSRRLVRDLASRISSQGRAVYVFSASKANTRFYLGSGFELSAGFREMFFQNRLRRPADFGDPNR